MSKPTITAVALDTADLITAVGRLLALSKTAETELDRDAICECAAEWCTLLDLDHHRCMARATEIIEYAKQHAAAEFN